MPYLRKEIYKIEEVLPFVRTGKGNNFHIFDGDEIKMSSQRYILFKNKGVTCIKCGLEGLFFAKEKTIGQDAERFHFNLYGIKDGKEVMLTKDHIHPKSLGGKNNLSNYNVMCSKCNHEKANKI